MVSGISKVTFYDPATGVAVQINKIGTDSAFNIREPLSVEAADGSNVYSGDKSNVAVVSLDVAGYTQLETWMKNETPLRMVAAGVETFIAWRDECPITVAEITKAKTGERNGYTVTMAASGGEQNIFTGSNLLFVALGWSDSDSNNIMDGYAITATGTKILTASTNQGIEAGTGLTNLVMSVTGFEFPISGVALKFFNNLPTKEVTSGTIKIVEKNFANTILQTNSDSNILNTLDITTDATIYKMDIYLIDAGALTFGDIQSFGSPYLGKKSSGINNY